MIDLPDPQFFGAPVRFGSWRDGQVDAAADALHSDKRFIGQAMPTGSGKSLHAVMQAMMLEHRCCILTETKGLQSQYLHDWDEAGMVDVRGQNNYICYALAPGGEYATAGGGGLSYNCDAGPCKAGAECSLIGGGCDYFDAVRRAKRSKLVITNYSYWIAAAKQAARTGEFPLGKFDLLVLDEAHGAPSCLSDAMAIEVQRADVEGVLGLQVPDLNVDAWLAFASSALDKIESRLETLTTAIKEKLAKRSEVAEAQKLRSLRSTFESILGYVEPDSWVVDEVRGGVRLDPIWPAKFAEQFLFNGVPKVLLLSATIVPKTLHLLGIEDGQFDFFDYPSTFDLSRRPIYHIPSVPMKHGISDLQIQMWVRRIDAIISKRLDRKGIIHTVSYARQRQLIDLSKYREFMLVNATGNTASIVREFKEAAAPCILVSPSVGTGYDFPASECEYIIIGKVAFPDTRSTVMKARSASDPDYAPYLAAQDMVQAAGRGMRAPDDRCEVFIVDDQIKWFIWKYRRFAPGYFIEAYRSVDFTPAPPPRIERTTLHDIHL